MNAAALFLLLLLPPADTTGDLSAAIQSSLRQELGDVAMAIAPDTVVTPAMWRGPDAPMHAPFVGHIVWPTKDRAAIELLATKPGVPPVRRELTFAAGDSRSERGRAIGLVLAELLRESPAAAFSDGVSGGMMRRPQAPRLAFSGSFVAERVMSGHWADGLALAYGFPLGDALSIQARGMGLFGPDQYLDLGFGLGARWDFVRAGQGRYLVGAGLGGDVLRESASGHDSDTAAPSEWSVAGAASLAARVTVWRWLRVVGEADVRVLSGQLQYSRGEDAFRRTYTGSRWRPFLGIGLEVAM